VSVIILALFAVFMGFVFIAIMGKRQVPVLRDENLEQRGGKPVAFFEEIDDFQAAIMNLLKAQGLRVTDVRGVSEEEFEIFAETGTGLSGGVVVFHCVFSDESIGADRVSNLLSAVRGERAMKGIFITSGYFTADVHTIAEGPALDILNIEQLTDVLDEYGVSYRRSDEQVNT